MRPSMARSLLFGLSALCAHGHLHAQSNVEVYGLVDLHLGHTTNAAADSGVTRVNSGGMNTSRLGFRGNEDLGNGLKAVFNLEMGIAADTGVADNPLFKRQAFVGLEGGFGSLIVGRSFTSVYDFILPYDPMGYAPAYSWAPAGSGSGVSKYGMTFWYDNLVKYTVRRGGLSFGATYGFGEQGKQRDGAKAALAANYASGPWSVAATWERINGERSRGQAARRDVTTTRHAAGMVTQGRLKLQAAVRDFRNDAGPRARLYWAGASWQLSEPLTLTGVVYHQDIRHGAADAADPTMLVLRARYALSRRTDLYLTGAHARAGQGMPISLARDEAGFAPTQRSVSAGIQHRF